MNNFEKIKQMSIDEMADFICSFADCNCCYIHNNNMITTETIANGLELKILTHYYNRSKNYFF